MKSILTASLTAVTLSVGTTGWQVNSAAVESRAQDDALQAQLVQVEAERNAWENKLAILKASQSSSTESRDQLVQLFDRHFDSFMSEYNTRYTRRVYGGFGIKPHQLPRANTASKTQARQVLTSLNPAEVEALLTGAKILRQKGWYMRRTNGAKSYSLTWLRQKYAQHDHQLSPADVQLALFLDFMVAEGRL